MRQAALTWQLSACMPAHPGCSLAVCRLHACTCDALACWLPCSRLAWAYPDKVAIPINEHSAVGATRYLVHRLVRIDERRLRAACMPAGTRSRRGVQPSDAASCVRDRLPWGFTCGELLMNGGLCQLYCQLYGCCCGSSRSMWAQVQSKQCTEAEAAAAEPAASRTCQIAHWVARWPWAQKRACVSDAS